MSLRKLKQEGPGSQAWGVEGLEKDSWKKGGPKLSVSIFNFYWFPKT